MILSFQNFKERENRFSKLLEKLGKEKLIRDVVKYRCKVKKNFKQIIKLFSKNFLMISPIFFITIGNLKPETLNLKTALANFKLQL